jgi:hypothetical protein
VVVLVEAVVVVVVAVLVVTLKPAVEMEQSIQTTE